MDSSLVSCPVLLGGQAGDRVEGADSVLLLGARGKGQGELDREWCLLCAGTGAPECKGENKKMGLSPFSSLPKGANQP